MNRLRRTRLGLTLALLLGLSACIGGRSPASSFYLLSPTVPAESGAGTQTLVVQLQSVSLPAYLDGREIITRETPYEITSAAYDRWAEPLEENFARVLEKDLLATVPGLYLARSPWESAPRETPRLSVRVLRFERIEDTVVLEARWRIDRENDRGIRGTGRYTVSAPGSDYTTLVGRMSEAVAQLAVAIGEDVAALR